MLNKMVMFHAFLTLTTAEAQALYLMMMMMMVACMSVLFLLSIHSLLLQAGRISLSTCVFSDDY